MMVKQFVPDMKRFYDTAEKIFLEISGLDREGRKYTRMRNDAMAIREKVEKRITIRGIYGYVRKVSLEGSCASIAGETFVCDAFRQIDGNCIMGAYVYAVSVGDFSCPESPVMEQLYADIWGSAFADAARLSMKEEMARHAALSDSFGPGFYGMDISETRKIDALIGLRKAGIELRENNVMIPLKSCVGILFSVSDGYVPIKEECKACRGNRTSCTLCGINGSSAGSGRTAG